VDWRNPEHELLAGELRRKIEGAVEQLPPRQREVIVLRDLEGWTSEEVRTALGLSQENQRVLLHRARTRVRQGLAAYLAGDLEPAMARIA
jgi:RNA polymerase sigma-70 factor (ECF subfamily)